MVAVVIDADPCILMKDRNQGTISTMLLPGILVAARLPEDVVTEDGCPPNNLPRACEISGDSIVNTLGGTRGAESSAAGATPAELSESTIPSEPLGKTIGPEISSKPIRPYMCLVSSVTDGGGCPLLTSVLTR